MEDTDIDAARRFRTRPLRACSDEELAALADELDRDLIPLFGGHCPDTIRAHIRRAISDLRGSVSVEALPEMAARLAMHRLSHDAPAAVS
jgi:hypothetical protein